MKPTLQRLPRPWSPFSANVRSVAISLFFVSVFLLTSVATARLPEKVEDGVMLHCYNWPFKSVEFNLDRITAAGFNAIQFSPIQRSRQPDPRDVSDDQPTGPW
jgi:hypothetical protein